MFSSINAWLLNKHFFIWFGHLNASLLISSGVDVKTVQSVLGHSQASTTLDIYAAAFRDREAQALGVVADILTEGKQRKAE